MGFLIIYLFFQEEFRDFRKEYLGDVMPLKTEQEKNISDLTLKIAYSSDYQSLDPIISNTNSRSRTLNIYESLVKTDRNLQFEPGLALSWGRFDDTTWEFKLRPDVLFHDGSTFDADDVISSFNRAIKLPQSDLKNKLNTIKSIDKTDDLTIVVSTYEPDPILINRVSSVLISPQGRANFKNPVGTGPYKYSAEKEHEIAIERFNDYWGQLPFYKTVLLQTIPNRFSRIDALKNGEVNILANVPPTFANELEDRQAVTIISVPSLEVNFLVFNFKSDLLEDERIRKAISIAFNKDAFVEFSNGYATPSNQFVSNGVFGFNPDIEAQEQDVELAKSLIREYDPFMRPSVSIDMVLGAEAIGDFIKSQLNDIGVTVNINYITFDTLRDNIFNKESQMYLLGWRSEMGDASEFLENVVHTDGNFNGGSFSNKKVDQLIELGVHNLDESKRLEQFQTIMRIITKEEIIGVPLFETEIIYGIRVGTHFHPRLDGFILASEVSKI